MTTTHPSPLVEGPMRPMISQDIDLTGGSNGELQDLANRLVDRATAYGMKVSTEKSKIMTNNTNKNSTDISMTGQQLEEVTSFKYLGQPCARMAHAQQEVRIRIASAMARIWWRCNTNFKFKLYKSRHLYPPL